MRSSGTSDSLEAKIVNTGSVNLYNFTFEILTNSSAGFQVTELDVNSTSQKTTGSPLKPGQSAILKALFTIDVNGTLKEVKVLNLVCPSLFVTQEL